MSSFWEGVLAGYGIAIPVGAIAVLIVDMGLRRGFTAGFMAGAGAASADLIYAFLAAVAGAAVAPLLAPLATSLRLASALILILIGGYGLWRARNIRVVPDSPTPAASGQGHLGIYGRFLGLTLLNPLTVAYFGALILARDAGSTVTAAERVAFVLGAGLASLSWQTALAGTGALAGQYLSPRFRLYTTIVGNLIVIALGVRILVQLMVG